MPKLKANNINLYYEIHGKGDPLILIAGLGTDHLTWFNSVELFAQHYQVIVFDNRGAGQSDCPDYPYTISMMADDTLALCHALDINAAHFIGNSMGGMILQDLAYRFPKIIKSMVLSNTSYKIEKKYAIFSEGKLNLIQAGANPEDILKISFPWVFSSNFLAQPGMLQTLVKLGLSNPYPITLAGLRNQIDGIADFNSLAWLNKIKSPCLVIGAENDIVFLAHEFNTLLETIPNAKSYFFAEAAHVPMIEQPEKFFEICHQFISLSS